MITNESERVGNRKGKFGGCRDFVFLKRDESRERQE